MQKMFWLRVIVLANTFPPIRNDEVLRGKGNFSIDVVVPGLWNGSFYQPMIVLMEAAQYAVQQVNKHDYLYGYKMVYTGTTDRDISEFWLNSLHMEHHISLYTSAIENQAAFIIGPSDNVFGLVASSYNKYSSIPQISYGVTSAVLENSSKSLFKTAPSDVFRFQAALNLLQQLKWDYVSVISSFHIKGNMDALLFTKKLAKHKICLGKLLRLGSLKKKVQKQLETYIRKIHKERLSLHIITFTDLHDSLLLLKEVAKLASNTMNPFKIIWFYGAREMFYFYPTKRFEHIVISQSISIEINQEPSADFANFTKPRTQVALYQGAISNNTTSLYNSTALYKDAVKKYYSNFYEIACQDENCRGPLPIAWWEHPPYSDHVGIDLIMHSVYSAAKTIRNYLKLHCARFNNPGRTNCSLNLTNIDHAELLKLIKKISNPDQSISTTVPWDTRDRRNITYDIVYHSYKIGERLKNTRVGRWTVRRPNRMMTNEQILQLNTASFHINVNETWPDFHIDRTEHCKPECPPNYIREPVREIPLQACCWECVKCPNNSIVLANTCVPCVPNLEVANLKTMTCVRYPTKYAGFSLFPYHYWAIVFLMAALSIFTAIILNTLRLYRFAATINFSMVSLTHLLLVGLVLLLLGAVLFLLRPSMAVCQLRFIVPPLGFHTVLCALTCKLRVIEKRKRHNNEHKFSYEIWGQILAYPSGMTVLAYLLPFTMGIKQMFGVEEQFLPKDLLITDFCTNQESIFTSLAMHSPMLFSFSLAFLTAVPLQYNKLNFYEARFIIGTLLAMLLSWMTIPAILNQRHGIIQPLMQAWHIVANVFIVLIGIFVQRLYVLARTSTLLPTSTDISLSEYPRLRSTTLADE